MSGTEAAGGPKGGRLACEAAEAGHHSSDIILPGNPGAGYRALKASIDEAVARVLASGTYILGPEGAAFESEFAAWLGARHAIGCANGTDAIALALRALGVGAGASVATVSHTAVATVAAIEMAGAEPVLVDVEPNFYTIDTGDLNRLLDDPPAGLPPVRAVVAVHLYGQAADLAPILAACERHGVYLIEDCSQAHGATYHGRKVGTFGRAATFSLYPTKNLGALGDGGIIATDDSALAERISLLRQYGWRKRNVSEVSGVNSRLDEMQAAILRVKLAHLDAQNRRRGEIAAAYDRALSGLAVKPPARRPGALHVFHQYVVQSPHRAVLQEHLRGAGIGTSIHYPVPVHRQPAYEGKIALGPSGCRATEDIAQTVLSLPLYPELTDAQITRIGSALRHAPSQPG